MHNTLLQKKIQMKFAVGIIAGVAVVAFFAGMGAKAWGYGEMPNISLPNLRQAASRPQVGSIVPFSSPEEFAAYIEEAGSEGAVYGSMGMGGATRDMVAVDAMAPGAAMEKSMTTENGGGSSDVRVSETTVQVAGIDEPDIVKTDGKNIYVSQAYLYRGPMYDGGMEKMIGYPYTSDGATALSKVFPPKDMSSLGTIAKGGELLVHAQTLVVLGGTNIYGYDVSNAAKPLEKWNIDLEKSSIVASRLYDGALYVVLRNAINEHTPCPLRVASSGESDIIIPCDGIYHPVTPVAIDVTFTTLVIDPGSGIVQRKSSFVGSSGSSTVYMSPSGIYVTYFYQGGQFEFLSNFLSTSFGDITPSWVLTRLTKLASYDISEQAKMVEYDLVWNGFLNSLDDDERLRVENELANRITEYYEEHKRDLERTGIVKMRATDLVITANGAVPGYVLNQFALDEHEGYLRVATTVGEYSWFGWWGWGSSTGNKSANDVYVLDEDLSVVGSVKDLGLEERIYAVRFIGDKGYVVTFRQTDPFYVLDLSTPSAPRLAGTLKIPGYSSFLHPIDDDMIVGIGQDDWRVKISLFDVSDPNTPKEVSKYMLDEYWSDAVNTHHAFLLDKDHGVFFLPGGKGGYVFSYGGKTLKLTKAVSGVSAQRAVYIGDYLYVVGTTEIIALDENTWEKVNSLKIQW